MPAIAAELIPTPQVTVAPITEAERAANMAALEQLLDRYASDGTRVPRPALANISDVLLRAHAHATTAPHAARWALIHPDLFDPTLLPSLRVFGVACRAVLAALASSDGQESRAKLPVELVQKATEHRARLQRYMDYQLADDPKAMRELDSIRVGSGYLDLESDLRRLSVLNGDKRTWLEVDRSYRATDAAEATALADQIGAELANVPGSPAAWVDRLWSAIRTVYANHVHKTAEWLFKDTPSELASYASIYAGFGRPRSDAEPRTPAEPAGDTPPAPPAPPVGPPVVG